MNEPRVNIARMTIDELGTYFRDLTMLQEECIKNGDSRTGNKAYNARDRVFREVRKRGCVSEFFPPLFEDQSDAVRCSAAALAWSFFPEVSEKILTEIASGNRSINRLNAEMVLKGRKSGGLWYDFERENSKVR